jgi:hypothetical protein
VNINSAVFCDVTGYKNTWRHTQENYHNSETAKIGQVKSIQQLEIEGCTKYFFSQIPLHLLA